VIESCLGLQVGYRERISLPQLMPRYGLGGGVLETCIIYQRWIVFLGLDFSGWLLLDVCLVKGAQVT